jgi:hypothetical protein
MLRRVRLRVVIIIVLGFAGLSFGTISQAVAQATRLESALCPADCPPPDHSPGAVHKHCVKLTWRASVPASNLPKDKVIGYKIYRSEKSHDPKPQQINSKLCTNTAYVDTDVTPGKTYFYVVSGVARGVPSDKESGFSNQAPAPIPSP